MTYGGSLIRPEATGFGAVYFLRQMLQKAGMDIKGQTIAISGFGNVAWGAAKKATELGAKVVTLSGPDGYVYDPDGLNDEKINYMLELRASNNDVVEPYVQKFPGAKFFAGRKPWEVKVDIAMPCATQNELDGEECQEAAGQRCEDRGRGFEHGLPSGGHRRLHRRQDPLRTGQGRQRRRRGHLGVGDDAERQKLNWTAEEVDAKAAPDHVVDPPRPASNTAPKRMATSTT